MSRLVTDLVRRRTAPRTAERLLRTWLRPRKLIHFGRTDARGSTKAPYLSVIQASSVDDAIDAADAAAPESTPMSIMENERRLRAQTAGLPKALPRKPPAAADAEAAATPSSGPAAKPPTPPSAKPAADSAGRDARTPAVTALYNGACPVCRFEMSRYRRIGGGDPSNVAFLDVTTDPAPLARHGLTLTAVMRRMHVATADDRIVQGMDAFVLLWRQMPRYRWLARTVGLPGVRHVAALFYEGVLVPVLWRVNRRRRAAMAAEARGARRTG